jgi:uncharacterized protein (DUF362 family)
MKETCGPAPCPEDAPRHAPRISRRRALGCLALGALGLSGRLTALAESPAGPAPRLALARNGDPAALTRRAVEALGGMGRFVSRGATVCIKPNIGWDRTPELGANTHPEVVAALVTLALEAGAKRVRVMDHTCNDPRRCYARSGIEAAARQAGAEVIHLPDGRGTEMDIRGERIRTWPVHREVVEADLLINAPVAKHHSLSQASLGMKNWLGAIDGRRNQLHQEIGASCVDLAAFFRPGLTVLDATRVLRRNGPQGGDPADVEQPRTLMAGVDPVAIEAFGAGLLGLSTDDLPHIAMAAARGLGAPGWDGPGLATVELRG